MGEQRAGSTAREGERAWTEQSLAQCLAEGRDGKERERRSIINSSLKLANLKKASSPREE